MAAFILKMLGLPVQVYSIGEGTSSNYIYPSSKIATYPNNNNLYKYVNPMLSSCCDCAKGLNVVNIADYVPILGEPGTDIKCSYYGYTDSFIHDDTYNSNGTRINVGYNTQCTSVYGNMGVKYDESDVPEGCCYVDCCCSFDCLYSCVPKINEANIPYLHGELVKYGTIPWAQICENTVRQTYVPDPPALAVPFTCYYSECCCDFEKMADNGTVWSMLQSRLCVGKGGCYKTDDDRIQCVELFGCCGMSQGYGLVRLGLYRDSSFTPGPNSEGGCICFNQGTTPYPQGTNAYYLATAKNCQIGDESGVAFMGGIYQWNYCSGNLIEVDHISAVYRNVTGYNSDAHISDTMIVVRGCNCYDDGEGNLVPHDYAYLDISSNPYESITCPTLCCYAWTCWEDTIGTQWCFCGDPTQPATGKLYIANSCCQQLSDYIEISDIINTYHQPLVDEVRIRNFKIASGEKYQTISGTT